MSGIITGPYFKAYFRQPSRSKLGAMVAILEIGALGTRFVFVSSHSIDHTISCLGKVTSILAGRLGDALGRRQTLFLGATVFVAGGAVQTATTGFNIIVLGRLISGAGVGLLS
jgi:predicted MFS family arabinose efflux permease